VGKWLRVGAVAAAGALLVSACGSSGSSSSSAGGSTGTTGSTSSSAGKPVYGGNLTIARAADSQSMNNTTVFDNESIWVFEQIYQTLYTVNTNGKGVKPELATGYSISPNNLTYTFTLRSGVKFSNGQPMTSADVKFSIDQSRKAAAGWGYIDSAIKSVTAPSPLKVVILLSHPWAPLLADLSLFSNGIIPNNYGGQTETAFYNHPVGTGPFKWDVWTKGKSLKLVKNTNYWQPGLPYLNSVTWTDVPDSNTRQLQLEGDQAQIDEFPAWSSVSSLKSQSGVSVDLFDSTRTDYLAFNEKRKPFQDAHVRQAISSAINRQALISAVLFGNGKTANSFMPPQLEYYDAASPGLQYNLTQAKKDMAESSVPKGFTTSILIPSGEADDLSLAQIMQSELKPLGITLNIQQLDANTASTDQQDLDYDMTLSYWTMDIPDPDELVTFSVDPNAGSKSFFTDYDNPTVVKEASEAEQTYNSTQRAALYAKIQTQAADDAFMAFLYYSPYAYATTTGVHDFFVTPLGNYHLENTWISKG
jgi:peptide/nickel transport system substrate-binding protein